MSEEAASEVFKLFDDGLLSRDQAASRLADLGGDPLRVTTALDMLMEARHSDEILNAKIVSLLERKATAREWMRELGRDYGRACYLVEKMVKKLSGSPPKSA